jgi:hypothetical protein
MDDIDPAFNPTPRRIWRWRSQAIVDGDGALPGTERQTFPIV